MGSPKQSLGAVGQCEDINGGCKWKKEVYYSVCVLHRFFFFSLSSSIKNYVAESVSTQKTAHNSLCCFSLCAWFQLFACKK